jgi:RNA 2',3'-cyclic 3'-phosphodiesterase
MTERTRRLFFALWPSDELRHQIEHETHKAARRSGGRVIPGANLHITLAFLGAVPESKLADAIACAQATIVQPFDLVLGELKWWERQQLLCLEPTSGQDAMQALVGRLQEALRAKGFAVERRPFRAHVTLAREVRPPRTVGMPGTQEQFSARRVHEFKPIRQLRWQVQRIELVESRTLPTGSAYSLLLT